MPTAEQMRTTMLTYLERVSRGDVDGVIELFSDDISVEDPVGGPPETHVVGRDNVHAFFAKGFVRSRPMPSIQGPVRTTGGNEAAIAFKLGLHLGDKALEFDVIDVMRFDANGKICSLRAFWNPAEGRLLGTEPGSRAT
jgi:steroid delta-isomerase